MNTKKLYTCGLRGCVGQTKRRGKLRYCAQKAIVWDKQGRGWCFYHNPDNPHEFGERAKPQKEMTLRYRYLSPPSLAPIRRCVVALALALSGMAGCMIGGMTP